MARDWAAQSLLLKPPTLLVCYFGAAQKDQCAVTSPNAQGDLEGNPKPTVRPSKAVSPLRRGSSRRRRRPRTQGGPQEPVPAAAPPQSRPCASQRRGGHRDDETPRKSQVGPNPNDAHASTPEIRTSYRPRSPSSHTPRYNPSDSEARAGVPRTSRMSFSFLFTCNRPGAGQPTHEEFLALA